MKKIVFFFCLFLFIFGLCMNIEAKEISAATVAVTGVKIKESTLVLKVGETANLTAVISPSNATNKEVKWSSSNTSIATVSSSGVVTAKAKGTATITVTTINGSKKATVTFTVNPKKGLISGKGGIWGYTSPNEKTPVRAGNDFFKSIVKGGKGSISGDVYTYTTNGKTYKYNTSKSILTVSGKSILMRIYYPTGIDLSTANTFTFFGGTGEQNMKGYFSTLDKDRAQMKTSGIIILVSSTGTYVANHAIAATDFVKAIVGQKKGVTNTIGGFSLGGEAAGKAANDGSYDRLIIFSSKFNASKTPNVINKEVVVYAVKADTKLSGDTATTLNYLVSSKYTKVTLVTNESSKYNTSKYVNNFLVINPGNQMGTGHAGANITKAKVFSYACSTIKKSDKITITEKKAAYTGKGITGTAKATSGLKVTLTYYSDSTCKTKTTTTNATAAGGTPKTVGTYYAIGKTVGNANYNKVTSACTKAVVINKANDTITITAKTAKYSGSVIKATTKATSGLKVTLTYYSDSTCKTKTTATNATAAGGAPKNAGTYYAIGKTAGNANYNKSTSACTKAVVIEKATAKITCANKTYNGSAQTIAKCTGGKVSNASKTDVGSYTITCKGDNNHKNATSTLCKIDAVNINNLKISKLENKSYTGKQITPDLIINHNTKTLKNGTDYTLSYQSNINPGVAKVTVAGKGNYKGSTTVTFNIVAYKVKLFDSQESEIESDGNVGISSASVTLVATLTRGINAKMGKLPTPVRNSYKFLGWYTSPSGGTKVTSSTKVTKDMSLYSRWQLKEIRIYYLHGDANVGNGYTKTGIFISKNGTYTYQSITGLNTKLYDYKTFGLSMNGFTLESGKEWCTNSSIECFDQTKNYSYKNFLESSIIDMGDYYTLVLLPNWTRLPLPDYYQVPVGYSETNKQYSSGTLKYRVIKKNDSNNYYALIWVKNANAQLNSYNNNLNGGQRYNLINAVAKKSGNQNKGIIGVNGSFTWGGRANIPIIASEGNIVRNTAYQTWRNYNGQHQSLIYGVLGVNSNGTLIKMNVENKYLSNAGTNSEKLSETGFQFAEDWVRNNGVRNTWAITNFQTSDWTTASGGADNRTSLCQIDNNNFVLSVDYDSPTNIAYKMHQMFDCRVVINMDGGGSTGMYHKTNSMTNMDTIKQINKDQRSIADMLYFVEQ